MKSSEFLNNTEKSASMKRTPSGQNILAKEIGHGGHQVENFEFAKDVVGQTKGFCKRFESGSSTGY